jgi:methionyl-tRNA formyltransferase
MLPLKALSERHKITGIVESAPRNKNGSRVPKRFRPRGFCGRTFLKAWAGLKKRENLYILAARFGAHYFYFDRDGHRALADFLKKLHPDIICVASLSQLLKKEVLDIPKHGVLNLHPSQLPKYRGAFPWFWQYYMFEREFGVTVHRLDQGEDTGPIVKQVPMPVPLGMDVAEAIELAANIGAKLMAEAVDEIEAGTAEFKPQPVIEGFRARVVRRDEALIDWDQWDIERVWHVMRGTYPWLDPVEYPEGFKGRCKVGDFERRPCTEVAGRLYRDDQGYYVAHRQGIIRLRVEG